MYDPMSLVGQEIAKIKVTTRPPAAMLEAADIADLWDLVFATKDGRKGVVLAVGGDVAHASDWLVAVDADFRWVRTAAKTWRLGWPNDARPPIVRTAMLPNRRAAFERALDWTGKHTLPALVRQAAGRVTAAQMPTVIDAIAATTRRQGRRDVTAAWDLLCIDGANTREVAAGALAIGMAVSTMQARDRDGEVMAALAAWTAILNREPNNPDPFAAAMFGREPTLLDEVYVRIRNDENGNGNGTLH